MYKKRYYRNLTNHTALKKFEVLYYESDLFISAEKNLKQEAYKWLAYYHDQISSYIRRDPVFEKTLLPYKVSSDAPKIIKLMTQVTRRAKVGPMASVAGAIAEFVANKLLKYSGEIIVENGGDIFMCAKTEKKIGIFAGLNSGYNKLCLKILPEDTPCGICTSSATIGHSLSFGKTLATVIIAKSAAMADAFATAIGNMVSEERDIPHALDFAKKQNQIQGLIIITRKHLAACGKINFDVS